MNYINKGKRDILIIPDFEEIEEIQEIRKKYDELYKIIPPHITLAFPFKDEISNDDLKIKLKELLKDVKPFKIRCKGITLEEDKKVETFYIFLNVLEGKERIKDINKMIYTKIFKKTVIENYIPHITLGNINNPNENIEFDKEFETIVNKIIVEQIGKNEESIIEFEIDL